MKTNSIKKYATEFFSNKFILRFIIWLIGIGVFSFGINFVVHSGVGQDTYDSFFNPIRTALGINIKNLGLAVLLPGGTILLIISSIMYYARTKKVRVDYILAVIPLVFSGFIIDLIGKLDFFETMNAHAWGASDWPVKGVDYIAPDWVFKDFPIHILWVFIGVPMMYLGIGIFSGVRVMPNPYAVLVLELSIKFKKKFSAMQLIVDICFVTIGLIIIVICAATGRVAGGITTTWPDVIKTISLGTVIAMLVQGIIVGKSMLFLEKLFGYQIHA